MSSLLQETNVTASKSTQTETERDCRSYLSRNLTNTSSGFIKKESKNFIEKHQEAYLNIGSIIRRKEMNMLDPNHPVVMILTGGETLDKFMMAAQVIMKIESRLSFNMTHILLLGFSNSVFDWCCQT